MFLTASLLGRSWQSLCNGSRGEAAEETKKKRASPQKERTQCFGARPSANVLNWDESAYSSKDPDRHLIVCPYTKLMEDIDLINSDYAGYKYPISSKCWSTMAFKVSLADNSGRITW